MEIGQSIFLGIIQGLGEFLPISSSGHLILVPWFFGWHDGGLSFDVALHFGTLLAILAYFWKEWLEIFRAALGKKDVQEEQSIFGYSGNIPSKFLWIIVIATIPGVVSGLFLEDAVEGAFRNPLLISFNLVFWGIILYAADVYYEKLKAKDEANGKNRVKGFYDLSFQEGILIGLSQALAVIPGTSRSGVTISAGLFLGLDRISAAKFSFLMLTPIVFGATMLKIDDLIKSFDAAMFVGIVASFVSGYFSIKYLIKFLGRISYRVFFWYRFILAIVITLLYFYFA